MKSDRELLDDDWRANGLKLFDYQETGIKTMVKWHREKHGGINADEMGLGKTCQAVTTMTRLFLEGQGPFLVLAPLSVCSHWASEVTRFSCGRLEPIEYVGHEDQRTAVRESMEFSRNSVFITAYHIIRREDTQQMVAELEQTLPFSVVVVDEAQTIKNLNSQLTSSLSKYKGSAWFLLLTGTPIQNNLAELYSLLTFVDMEEFPEKDSDLFVSTFRKAEKVDELKALLAKYMLRRTKAEVFTTQMAECQQVLLYHGISDLQKEMYKGIISKNANLFKQSNKEISLVNILMQLRKCCIHPYMFTGVEPEPFVEGEHLVDASGKLQVLDRLLRYAKERGHRCLLFSQFLGSLDIVEDFLRLRDWRYERLDGTSRAEERQEKVNSFQKTKGFRKGDLDDGPFCFLLTTKAGGVGLNLTAADTVIFLDSDWNPQNDIQAMARCHRIGQTKPVRVIRLVARYTVDQYVVANARDKLKLTDQILGNQDSKIQAVDVVKVLKENFGLLMESDSQKFKCTDKELEDVIGRSDENGEWMSLDDGSAVDLFVNPDECDENDVDRNDYARFEGVSYRPEKPKTDEWDELLKEAEKLQPKTGGKRKREAVDHLTLSPPVKRARKPVDKVEMWAKKGYTSLNLESPPEDWEGDDVEDETALKYVFGDVTKPKTNKYRNRPAIILHSVDNGGSFGVAGLFRSIRALDPSIGEAYEKAGEMRDLQLGGAHLVPVNGEEASTSADSQMTYVALLVAQSSKRRDVLKSDILENCLRRVSKFAADNGCTIHTPRIGKYTDISWYTVDRMLKKHFSLRGIPCLVYYHPPAKKEEVEEEEEEEDIVEEGDSKQGRQTPVVNRIPFAELPIPRDDDGDSLVDVDDDEEDLKLITLTPEKKHSGRERRSRSRAEKKQKEPAEQESTSEDSVTGSSDWEAELDEGKEESDNEEEYEDASEDEEEEDSEVEVDEDSDLEVIEERKPRKGVKTVEIKKKPLKVMQRVQRTPSPPRTKKNTQIFYDQIFSIYALDAKTLREVKHPLMHHGAYWVTSAEDLHTATHCVVPKEWLADEEKLEEMKKKFDADCIFVRSEFVMHAIKNQSAADIAKFVV